MNKTLGTILATGTLLVGGGTIEMVPQQVSAEAWGQYRVADYVHSWSETIDTGTSSVVVEHINNVELFPDDNGDGIISYSVGKDKKGKYVSSQITEAEYAKLGGIDGAKHNTDTPVKYQITVSEAIIEGLMPETAEAAVAQDSSNKYTACVTGTSCTYSFTNTAGNFVVNSSISYSTNPGTVTMTYAGVSMTQAGSNQSGGGAYGYTFYTTSAAATGANNLVTNTTGSLTNGFYDHVSSFSGTNATSPVEGITQSVTADISNKSLVVTTLTDNSMAFMALNSAYGRTYSAGANTTLVVGDSQTWLFRSTNVVTPAGAITLNATISAGTEPSLLTGFGIKEGSTAPVSTTNNSCHGELHGVWYCQK